MKLKLLSLAITSVLMIGCSSNTLYYWGSYQQNLYQILQTPETHSSEQIIALEKLITLAASNDKPVPPGLYANLGMLYVKEGKLSEAKARFEKEKALFPESSVYMSFLIKNLEDKENKND